jgi:hypothetical protein
LRPEDEKQPPAAASEQRPIGAPPSSNLVPPAPIPPELEEDEFDFADAPRPAERRAAAPNWSQDDTQPKPPGTAPQPPADPGTLSIQERHQLLIRTIQLYEEEWKLAGIRANPKNNCLQAFLIPRHKQLDLKEAVSKNQALVVIIDPRGNIEIKEPKKPNPLRRLGQWFSGE